MTIKKRLQLYKRILNLKSPDFFIQTRGEQVFIGIESDSLSKIDLNYNSWYNWCATNGELHWINEKGPNYLAYIFSSLDKYLKYWFNVLENRFAINTKLEIESDLHNKILLHLAKKMILLTKNRDFMPPDIDNSGNHYYNVDLSQAPLSIKEFIKDRLNKEDLFFDAHIKTSLPL